MAWRLPKASEHTAVVGRNGTGKSQAGFWLLSQRDLANSINVIVDYKGEELCEQLTRAREIGYEIPKENGLYVLRADPENDDAMRDLLRKIRRTGNIGLFVDEGYMIPGEKKGPFQALLTQGRSLNIPIITLSQRPVEINRFVFSEAGHILYFDLNDERDQDTVKMFTPKGFVDWLPAGISDEKRLLPYHFKWYNLKDNEYFGMLPVPSASEIIDTIDAQLKPKHRWL